MDPVLKKLDDELVRSAAGVHVLRHLSWHLSVQDEFLSRWRGGQPQLPEFAYPPLDLGERRAALERIAVSSDGIDDPVATFVGDTARSYAQICELMEVAGTARAGELSIALYGRPRTLLPGSRQSNLDAARYFIDISREYYGAHKASNQDYCLSAEFVRAELRRQIDAVIHDDVVDVVIDPTLASKAAAGSTRIRIRGGTSFSEDDVQQLLQHEAFVHSLTALNGRRQPQLKSLALGAPRTTAAQEGLATFAELVTGAIDIARMERIALRVEAIDRALAGADFIEVFEFFLARGQPEIESFNSTMRVFRGVPLTGGSAFTKDVVYLTGLLEVHTFFRWALRTQQLHMCEILFAGRMKLSDVILLKSGFDDGTVASPTYLPPWMTRTNGLTAYLAFSLFANQIEVADVESKAFTV